MDVLTQTLVWVGSIGGSLIGLLGGLFGTWMSIRGAKGPQERAFMVRASLVCWAAIAVFLAVVILVPPPWNLLAWVVYGPGLYWGIRAMNAGAASARARDNSPAEI